LKTKLAEARSVRRTRIEDEGKYANLLSSFPSVMAPLRKVLVAEFTPLAPTRPAVAGTPNQF